MTTGRVWLGLASVATLSFGCSERQRTRSRPPAPLGLQRFAPAVRPDLVYLVRGPEGEASLYNTVAEAKTLLAHADTKVKHEAPSVLKRAGPVHWGWELADSAPGLGMRLVEVAGESGKVVALRSVEWVKAAGLFGSVGLAHGRAIAPFDLRRIGAGVRIYSWRIGRYVRLLIETEERNGLIGLETLTGREDYLLKAGYSDKDMRAIIRKYEAKRFGSITVPSGRR